MIDAEWNAKQLTGVYPVRFEANDAGEDAEYDWTFGDGEAGSGRNSLHPYASPGEYVVTLTVTVGEDSGVLTQTITVNPPRIVDRVVTTVAESDAIQVTVSVQ